MKTVATVAIRLLLAFCPLVSHALGCAPQGLTITYKAYGKTVNVKLSPEAAPLYRAAAQQYRKLKTLLDRLDKLSKTILRHQAKLAESKRQD